MILLNRKILFLLIFSLFYILAFSQKITKVKGEYMYIYTNVTPEQAKKLAIDYARLDAIANEFGIIINGITYTDLSNINGISDISILRTAMSETTGIWLEDIKEPEIDEGYDKDLKAYYVYAKVYGKARERTATPIDLSAKILRNGTDDEDESDRFKDGNSFYLKFKAPIDGYLAVYLVDENDDVFCLFPYESDSDGKFEVTHNVEYTLFSQEQANYGVPSYLIDEYVFNCKQDKISNRFYILFSPTAFIKALDTEKDKSLPRQLSYNDFTSWLGKNKSLIKDFYIINKLVVIEK